MVAETAVSAEWQPLNEQERAVVTALSQRLAGFDTVAPDLLLAFVRGYLTDGVDTTERLLRESLEWRALPEVQADSATLKPPSGRRAFEAMYQAGPVGRDPEGRAIVMERVGALPMASLCQLDEAALIRHYVYTKEACRTLCRELSHAAGRRFYKAVVIVDLSGLSLSHTKPSALRVFQLLISKFQDSYPEFMVATYVINAPALFTGLWALVRPWLDPKVTAKVHILGGEKAYAKLFKEKGFVFDLPLSSPELRLSWLGLGLGLELGLGLTPTLTLTLTLALTLTLTLILTLTLALALALTLTLTLTLTRMDEMGRLLARGDGVPPPPFVPR